MARSRVLAVSFVVTVSLPGCDDKPKNIVISHNPPALPTSAPEPSMATAPTAPLPSATQDIDVAQVQRTGDGKCWYRPASACPPNLPCAIAFTEVPCPPGMADAGRTLPEAKDAKRATKRADGTCWYQEPMKCPPGVKHCNPPPPYQVECPAALATAIALPKAPKAEHVKRRPDGTCWYVEPSNCPPDAKCNPPEPYRVECP
jgi:hypothetical protein